MIHYQLRCSEGHAFDGWFRDSAGFEAQAAGGLVACPDCGDVRINRALMAPAIGKRRGAAVIRAGEAETPPAETKPETPAAPEKVAVQMPDQMRAVLQRIRAEIEKSSDYVGPQFADEARKIHRGETKQRSIYGESTSEQAEALADEGIEVARIPWVPRADG